MGWFLYDTDLRPKGVNVFYVSWFLKYETQ